MTLINRGLFTITKMKPTPNHQTKKEFILTLSFDLTPVSNSFVWKNR